MDTHLWDWMKICMRSNSFWVHNLCVFLLRLDYTKRVYQGVRVKHTVKDLLAEKRSRQTNGSRYNVSTTFVLSCLSQLHFSCKPNSEAAVDILSVVQLRLKKSPLLFTYWLVLWTNDPWSFH